MCLHAVVFIHMHIVIMKTGKTIMKISIHIGHPPISTSLCSIYECPSTYSDLTMSLCRLVKGATLLIVAYETLLYYTTNNQI